MIFSSFLFSISRSPLPYEKSTLRVNLNSPRLHRVLFFFSFSSLLFSILSTAPLLSFPILPYCISFSDSATFLCLPSSSSHNRVGKWLTAGNQARPGLLPTTHICYPHHTTCNPCLLTGHAGVCFGQWVLPSLRMSPMLNCSSRSSSS